MFSAAISGFIEFNVYMCIRLQASGFRLQASGFRLQASGFRLQASTFVYS